MGLVKAIWLRHAFNEQSDARPAGRSHRQRVILEERLGIRWHGRGPGPPPTQPLIRPRGPLGLTAFSHSHTHILPFSPSSPDERSLSHSDPPEAKQKAIIKPLAKKTHPDKRQLPRLHMYAVLSWERQMRLSLYSPMRQWIHYIKTLLLGKWSLQLLFSVPLWMFEHVLCMCVCVWAIVSQLHG